MNNFNRVLIISNTPQQIVNICDKKKINYIIIKKNELEEVEKNITKNDMILCYNTGIIVSKNIISKVGRSINLHPGSPEYPGRDPHHWAIYEGAKKFGATLHFMSEKVDEGNIIDVEFFNVVPNASHSWLLEKAIIASIKLLNRNFDVLCSKNIINIKNKYEWCGIKHTRKMMKKKCMITKNICEEELTRLVKAFHVDGFENIVLNLHKHNFFYKR